MSVSRVVWCVLLVVAVVSTARPVAAQQGAPADGEWRTFGGDVGSTKYSPLAQITAENFEQLEVKWRWLSPDGMLSKSIPGGGEWSAQLQSDTDHGGRDAVCEHAPVDRGRHRRPNR
jgi:glucose dehydrogenase